jgi:NAD+ kinase
MPNGSAEPVAKPRILLLANLRKPQVTDALKELKPWLAERTTSITEVDSHEINPQIAAKLPAADLAVVLGGDGTLLAQARALAERPLPLPGVNFGKLGFMAEFSIDDLKEHWLLIASGRCHSTHRIMLDVSVHHTRRATDPPRSDHVVAFQCLAVNDAVITAGPPFRMIELELILDPHGDGHFSTLFAADGVIISTPSGSTAYNLAAGGPIVSPQVDAICVTPLCPHSLSFRPIITRAEADTRVRLVRGNEGTTLVIDGQNSVRLYDGSEVRVKRSERSFNLLHNPSLSYWKLLAKKLHWAARPRRG